MQQRSSGRYNICLHSMVHPRKIFGGMGNQMFQMAYIYSQMREGNIPDIYLQDPKYFDKFGGEIKNLYGGGVGKTDKIAIHVRRGTNPTNPNEPAYYENPFYVNLCATDYYERAIAMFPSSEFIVFSDDIEWCKQQEIFKGCEFSEGLNEIDDLNKMASCRGHIIANSSYSWWGAFISPHGGKVVAPKDWFADGVERTKCPTNWIRV